MWSFLSGPELASLGSVIIIDIVMSGDNAIIIGMAAAGLPPALRRRAIFIGLAAATVLRILFAVVSFHLLAILGLTLAGGLLLLWVCWHMWREIRGDLMRAHATKANPGDGEAAAAPPKTFRQAMIVIVLADVSMSLDNVLAVAGAAHEFFWVLVFGLALSIALMALAANYIATMLERHNWIAYVGLVVVAYVAGEMIYRGVTEVVTAAA